MKYQFQMSFWQDELYRIGYKIDVPDAFNDYTNFLALKFKSTIDEEIYGMGLQYSLWNFKGKQLHLVSAEGGVGRGLQPVTEHKGIDAGSETITYAPATTFITNK